MPFAPARPCGKPFCPHLQPCPVHTGAAEARHRRRSEQGRRLYDTQRWRKQSKAFLAKHPLCIDCEAERVYQLATEVDHEVPHRGDEQLFWDETNWRARCTTHHSRKTRREVLT
jgi:5-methylcytosine-specific restriction protein A